MSRRRARSRISWSTVLLAAVVILIGGALLNAAGWVPVLIAAGSALALAGLGSKRGRRTRRRRR